MGLDYADKIGEVLINYDLRDGLYRFSINSHDPNEHNGCKKFLQFREEELDTLPKDPEGLVKLFDSERDAGHGLGDVELKSISHAIQIVAENHYRMCGP